jgi:hypothetical protein
MNHFSRAAAVVALTAALSGCALITSSPSIADLKYNPAKYHDRTVSVDGVVTSAWGVPLVPFKIYKIDDGTGELTVVSQGARTPTRGARVEVRGKVNEFAVFGGQSFGLHLQERSLKVTSGN